MSRYSTHRGSRQLQQLTGSSLELVSAQVTDATFMAVAVASAAAFLKMM